MFSLHPQLANDCITIGDGPLCRILLMNDCRYPWVVLVPRLEGVTELHQLSPEDLKTVTGEIVETSQLLESFEGIDKINVAALGNMVPQLHIHVVARKKTDAAWPKPIWGIGEVELYGEEMLKKIIDTLRDKLVSG